MYDLYVEVLYNQTFNQDGNKSAILGTKYYNPPNLIFQHLPVKEIVKKIEINRMRNGNIIDTLTSVDIQEIVKFGGKVIETYEVVIYRENFKITPYREVIEKLSALRQEYRAEGNSLLQILVILILNSFYGVQIRKDFDHFYKCKSEHWMQKEYDENVLDYWKLQYGIYTVKMKNDDGLDNNNT